MMSKVYIILYKAMQKTAVIAFFYPILDKKWIYISGVKK